MSESPWRGEGGSGGRIWKDKSVVWESHGKTRLISICTRISLAMMSQTNDSFQNDHILVSLDLPPPRKRFWMRPSLGFASVLCLWLLVFIVESLTRCLYLSGQPGISVASVRNFRGSSGPVQAGLRWSTLPPSSGSAVPLGGCASCVQHFSERSVHLRIWWCRCAFDKAALQQLNHRSSWLKNKKNDTNLLVLTFVTYDINVQRNGKECDNRKRRYLLTIFSLQS